MLPAVQLCVPDLGLSLNNFGHFGLDPRQRRLELWVSTFRLLLGIRNLLLNGVDLCQGTPRLHGFGKHLVPQLQLLVEYFRSCGRARVHYDLQQFCVHLSIYG